MSSGRVMDADSLPTGDVETTASSVPTRPAWLKPRQTAARQPKSRTPLPGLDPMEVALSTSPRIWTDRLRAVVFRAGFGWGWLASATLHVVLLGSLGTLAYQTHMSPKAELTGIFGTPGNDTILDIDSSIDAGGSLAPLELDLSGLTSATVMDPTASGSSSLRVFGSENGVAGGNGLGDGGNGSGGLGGIAGNVRVPASAITKGSFTVWTEPEDPAPGQAYEIVIQVQLSKDIKGYRLRDLTGRVRGTDGYDKQIRFKATDRKAVKEGLVQVRVDIPGAQQRLVKDTIFIRSEVLKEEQTIEIVF